MTSTPELLDSREPEDSAGTPALRPPAPRRPRRQWRRAWRALRELIDDPDQTEKAFEVLHALDGPSEERTFREFTRHPEGLRLLAERPSLRDALADREALRALPDDSFGRAVLAHYETFGLDPVALVALDVEQTASEPALDRDRAWFRERLMLMHDLWHVLTGYGPDGLGEAALLPFSHTQMGGFGSAMLTLGAGAHVFWHRGLPWLFYLRRAWRRGRRAALLTALPYEALLPLSLEAVRRLAGVEPPNVAHRGGVWREEDEAAAA